MDLGFPWPCFLKKSGFMAKKDEKDKKGKKDEKGKASKKKTLKAHADKKSSNVDYFTDPKSGKTFRRVSTLDRSNFTTTPDGYKQRKDKSKPRRKYLYRQEQLSQSKDSAKYGPRQYYGKDIPKPGYKKPEGPKKKR